MLPVWAKPRYIAALEEMKQELFRDRSGPLLLIDISGIDMTTAVINKAKELTAATKNEGIQDGPNVIVGLTGLQKAVAQLFVQRVHFCDSIEEAKDVAGQAGREAHARRLGGRNLWILVAHVRPTGRRQVIPVNLSSDKGGIAWANTYNGLHTKA